MEYRVHFFRYLAIQLSGKISRSHVIALSERIEMIGEHKALVMSYKYSGFMYMEGHITVETAVHGCNSWFSVWALSRDVVVAIRFIRSNQPCFVVILLWKSGESVKCSAIFHIYQLKWQPGYSLAISKFLQISPSYQMKKRAMFKLSVKILANSQLSDEPHLDSW